MTFPSPVPGVLLGLCLLCPVPSAASTSVESETTGLPGPVLLASSSPSDSTSEEKKVQVRKSDTRTRERSGSTDSGGDADADDDDDGGWFSDCFGTFIVDIFSSHDDSPGDAAVGHSSGGPEHSLAPETAWVPGVLAMIMPADSATQGVMIWDHPGGEGEGAQVVSHLPVGAEVVVRGSSLLESGTWVQVSLADAGEPAGWMAAEDLVARRTGEPTPSAAADTAAVRGPPLPVHLALDLSVFTLGPEDVGNEYVESPIRWGLRVAGPSAGAWQIGFAAGYSSARGTPAFNYVTSSQVDYPYASHLQIVDLGVDGGQDLRLGRTWTLGWALGPTLNWVQESAAIYYERFEGATLVYAGYREDVLARWRFGADARLWLGVRTDPGLRVGLLLRGFVIPWESHETRSLTLDFTGDTPITGASIGFYLGI